MVKKELSKYLQESFYKSFTLNEQLKFHSTIRLGGNAEIFAVPSTLFELNNYLNLAKEFDTEYKIIGSGSNILFSDKGFDGLVISTENFKGITAEKNVITVKSGERINSVINYCTKHGLSGLENLYGIPATLGGAVYQNASAMNTDISDNIVEVATLKNDKIKIYSKKDCDFSYRKSIFKRNNEIILWAKFSLKQETQSKIKEKIFQAIDFRNIHQPKGRSLGSTFKNTAKISAGKIIDECNLKGVKQGGAEVSTLHANFILANENCTSTDVYSLIRYIENTVKAKTNISLIREIELVGEF